MRQLIFIFILNILFFNYVEAQVTTTNWIVQTSFGIEKHDKRLFDYSEKEMLLAIQPEEWGTYHFNFSLNRKLKRINRFSFYVGAGISYEKATFTRPFTQNHFGDSRRILLVTNMYKKVKIPLALTAIYKVVGHWIISGELGLNSIFYRSIDYTKFNSDVFPYTEYTFELDEANLKLGINYQVKSILFGINTRLLNYQKIDKIIFNGILKDPRTNQKWELHNPLLVNFTIGYIW